MAAAGGQGGVEFVAPLHLSLPNSIGLSVFDVVGVGGIDEFADQCRAYATLDVVVDPKLVAWPGSTVDNARSKVRVSMSACFSAFSSTQRTD